MSQCKCADPMWAKTSSIGNPVAGISVCSRCHAVADGFDVKQHQATVERRNHAKAERIGKDWKAAAQ